MDKNIKSHQTLIEQVEGNCDDNHQETKKKYVDFYKDFKNFELKFDKILGSKEKINYDSNESKGMTNWVGYDSNTIRTNARSGGTNWIVKSEKTLEGAFEIKLKILNIYKLNACSMWYFGFGLIRSSSLRTNDYYYDCLYVFSCLSFAVDVHTSERFTTASYMGVCFDSLSCPSGDSALVLAQ